jgi:hypothetical protein
MKIELDVKLKDADGSDIILDDKPAKTLKDVCVSAVLLPIQEDDSDKKLNKYKIFKKLADAKTEVELTAEEIVIIKVGIGKFEPPLILGQCFELLEK